jgi:hypothetical protein
LKLHYQPVIQTENVNSVARAHAQYIEDMMPFFRRKDHKFPLLTFRREPERVGQSDTLPLEVSF